jgi:predicted DNA-binding protein with PD1-like motif
MLSTRALSHAGRPRTLMHPGAFNPVRIHSRHSAGARHIRLVLQPGQRLFDALVLPLQRADVSSASTTILGGFFSHIDYCVAPPDPSGQAVVAYTQPISAGRAFMIFGNATLGKNEQGAPVVHCHAAIRDEDGRTRGGHMLTQSCIVGDEPVVVLVTTLDSFELRVSFDSETNIPLLQPRGRSEQ